MIVKTESWVNITLAQEVEALIQKWAHIIPRWVEWIKISSDSEMSRPCEIRVHDEYRTATIVLGNQWAELNCHTPEEIIVHELCHLYTTPIARRSRSAIEAVVPDQESPLFKFTFDQVSEAMEACTEDLARMLLRNMK